MSPKQYRAALAQLEISQAELARVLDITDRTSWRWAAGDSPIPKTVVFVLRYWLKTGIRPDEI
jgi:DNA-binding transcriptional regulator YiaG